MAETVPRNENDAWPEYREFLLKKAQKDNLPASIDIPFVFTLGALNFAGVIHITDRLEDSWIELYYGPVPLGKCELRRQNPECCAEALVFKVCIRVRFDDRCLDGRVCTRNWDGTWHCPDWTAVFCW